MSGKPKGLPVYCDHVWDPFGAARRCRRCRYIWRVLEEPAEPKVVIGYVEIPEN